MRERALSVSAICKELTEEDDSKDNKRYQIISN